MGHAVDTKNQFEQAVGPVQSGASGAVQGGSIVDFLNKQGKDSSVAARAQLAFDRGLVKDPNEFIQLASEGKNAELNLQLLSQLQTDQSRSQSIASAGATNTQATSITEAIRSGNVNEFGVPNNLGEIFGNVLTAPSPNTPIDAAKLSADKSGERDINEILSAALNSPDPSTSIAGLLSLFNASTKESETVDAKNQELISLLKSTGEESTDLQAELDRQGVSGNIEQLKQSNLKIAKLKGEIEAFDVETERLLVNVKNQPVTVHVVAGQQARIREQRLLEKMAKTAALSAELALGQAYAGNADLGIQLAEQAIDLKYAPIFNSIEVLKTQIGIATEKMDKADTTRANIINSLIDIKFDDLEELKATEKEVEKILIKAALGSAPSTIIKAARLTGDPVRAASMLATYIDSGDGGGGNDRFSTTQENKGIANAGTDQATFRSYDEETQNYFINGDVNGTKSDIDKALEDFSLEEVLETIDQFEVNETIKQFYRNYAEGKAPEQETQEEQFSSFIRQLKEEDFTRSEAKKAITNELASRDNFNGEENIPGAIKDKIEDAVVEIYGRTIFQKVFPGGR